jgi:predicted  nucleic acid-binding Zn-ribbon protein
MSQPFKLYRLQQIDSQLDQAHDRLAEIAAILSDNAAIRKARGQADKTAAALEKAKKELRKAEENVHSQRSKIERSEATLYGGTIKNPKELQDIQSEAAALKRYLSVLEDRQLEAMLAVDGAEDTHQNAIESLESVTRESVRQNERLVEEKGGLETNVARLEKERGTTASTIEAPDLRLYEQLRKQRAGVAVARVVDNTCSACGTTLTASLLQASRSSIQLSRCDTCGRILYGG